MSEQKNTTLNERVLAEVKAIHKDGQADELRKVVYQHARAGKLKSTEIVVLKILRNEEPKVS